MMSMIENLENRVLLAVISNGLASGDTNFVEATIAGGGTVSQLTFGSHKNVIFSYNGYLDLGGNNTYQTLRVVNLSTINFGTAVNLDAQTAQSQATITLDTTGTATITQITIVATSHIDLGGQTVETSYAFSSRNYNMTNASFYQYLDADIRNISDDVLSVKGTIANNSLQLSTVNPTEYVWIEQQNGSGNLGAVISGYAADLFPALSTAISAGGFVPAATGTISAQLTPGTFPGIGQGWGPGDITTCTYYTMNASSGNTVSTDLTVFNSPEIPVMTVIYNAQTVPDGSTVRSTTLGTDFGTLLGVPVTHYYQIQNIGQGALQLGGVPPIQVTGTNASDFVVTRQPSQGVAGGAYSYFAITYIPTSSGVRTATISIASNDKTTTPYTFQVYGGAGTPVQPDVYEVDNTFPQAKVISTDGVMQYHSINVNNDVDNMTFNVVQDGQVVIETTAPLGDTMMRLYDANGNLIARNNDFNPGTLSGNVTSRISTFLPVGTYFVQVTEFGQNATIPLYGISVRAGAAVRQAPPVVLDPVTGALVVRGTNSNDNIAVDLYQTSVRAVVDSQSWFYPMTAVHSVVVNALQGADTIFIGVGVTNVYVGGGAGNDVITSETNTPITINGGLGNDSIVGGSGGDFIYGSDGNDTIIGGSGNNYIEGNAGDDFITSGSGNDTIRGNGGNDTILGGDGDNLIYGGAGNDSLVGGSGNDTIYAGTGSNQIDTGAGHDYVDALNGTPDTIFANTATDVLLVDPPSIDTVLPDISVKI